jgi:hypothetical protein
MLLVKMDGVSCNCRVDLQHIKTTFLSQTDSPCCIKMLLIIWQQTPAVFSSPKHHQHTTSHLVGRPLSLILAQLATITHESFAVACGDHRWSGCQHHPPPRPPVCPGVHADVSVHE